MDLTGGLGSFLRSARANATVAWLLLFGVGSIAAVSVVVGDLLWAGFALAIIAIALVPPATFRAGRVMLPWEVLALVTFPLAGRVLASGGMTQLLASHVAIAALALIVAVELHVFTPVRMTDWFAVAFVIVTTLATAGLWAVVQWVSDVILGTQLIPNLRILMIHFTGAKIAGFGAGILFTYYFRRTSTVHHRCCPGFDLRDQPVAPAYPSVKFRDRIGISKQREHQVVRILQLSLAGFFVIGLSQGDLSVIVNSSLAFFVTQLPAVLERDYHLSMDSGLVLWITAAVFVHAVGALGPYQTVWWWDNVAHALSASVVAAVGYTTVRAVSIYSSEVSIPPRLLAIFVLLFVVAAGVFWEVIEFLAGHLAILVGFDGVLIQYGVTDTVLDIVFDIIGGLIVATWGAAYLSVPIRDLTDWLDRQ